MDGTQRVQHPSMAAELVLGLGATAAAGAGGPDRTPAQVLTDLLDKLTALITAAINLSDQDQHNAVITKVCDDIA